MTSIQDGLVEKDLLRNLTVKHDRRSAMTTGLSRVATSNGHQPPLKRAKSSSTVESHTASTNTKPRISITQLGKMISDYKPVNGTNGMVFTGISDGRMS